MHRQHTRRTNTNTTNACSPRDRFGRRTDSDQMKLISRLSICPDCSVAFVGSNGRCVCSQTGLLCNDYHRHDNRTFNFYLKTGLTQVDRSDQTEHANLLQTTDRQQFQASLDLNVNRLFDAVLNAIPRENHEIVNNLPLDQQKRPHRNKDDIKANAQAFQRKPLTLDSALDR